MNRLALLSLLLLPSLSEAAYTCDPSATPAAIHQSFGTEMERLLGEQKAAEATHQADLTTQADALVHAGAWTPAERGKFYRELMLDDTFKAEEALKAKHLAAFMASMQAAERASAKDPAELCKHAEEAMATFGEIGKAGERQWQYMKSRMAQVPRK